MTDHGGAASPRTEVLEPRDALMRCLGRHPKPGHADAMLEELRDRYGLVLVPIRAAQEAPAPEGLDTEAVEVAVRRLRLTSPIFRQPQIAANFIAEYTAWLDPRNVLRAATPPTPAEPPNPDEDWTAEDERRAVLREARRAEARPPEGLDTEWLAELLNEAENEAAGTNFEWPSLSQRKVARFLAARLPAGGATKPPEEADLTVDAALGLIPDDGLPHEIGEHFRVVTVCGHCGEVWSKVARSAGGATKP